jgi:cytochrome c-type biogenesis protein CcmH
MTVFLVVAIVLIAVGLGSLLWPLLRGEGVPPAKQAAAVIALFRDQLRELEAERASGVIDDTQYQQSRRDIERNLLDAVAGADPAAKGPQRARWSAALVGIFVLISPIVLYGFLGTPDALIPGAISGTDGDASADAGGKAGAKGAAKPLTSAQVEKMIAAMVEALKKQPADPQGWAMLARAYAYQHQYPDAVRAYTKAIELTPKDARLLSDLADAMAMNNGRRLDGEPMKLIERALQIDPKEVKALALAGTAAFDHQEYAKAVNYWERAIKAAPNDAEFARSLKGSLDEARQLAGLPPSPAGPATEDKPPRGMAEGSEGKSPEGVAGAAQGAGGGKAAMADRSGGAPGAGVRGKVVLSAGLAAKAAPGDTVFVFARAAQGPRVPLALMRRQVKDLPFEFSLDDSMAMMPDFTMSKYSPVIVGARVSHSGDAIAAPGDLQGFSKAVTVGTNGVNVTIDQVVQ